MAGPRLQQRQASPDGSHRKTRRLAVVPIVKRRRSRRGGSGVCNPAQRTSAGEQHGRRICASARDVVAPCVATATLLETGAPNGVPILLTVHVGRSDRTVRSSGCLTKTRYWQGLNRSIGSLREHACLLRRGSVRRVRGEACFCSCRELSQLRLVIWPGARASHLCSWVKNRNRPRDDSLRDQNKAGLQRSLPPKSQYPSPT
jgi:hypothetical protein